MKLIATLISIVASANLLFAQNSHELQSPDGKIKVEVNLEKTINYNLIVDKKHVMKNSSFSIEMENIGILGVNPKLKSAKAIEVNKFLKPVIRQKTATIQDHYNELTLNFKNYLVRFRAYNNGIAYRFETQFKKDVKVVAETNKFRFADDAKTYFPEETSFLSHNERSYLYENLSGIANNRFGSLPTLIEPKAGPKILITESNLVDYPGMWLQGIGGKGFYSIFPHFALKSALKEGSAKMPTPLLRLWKA